MTLLVSSASAAVTLAAAISTDVMESANTNLETRADATTDIDIEDYDEGYSHYYRPHEGNSTLSATFSIVVTPEHYHMFSWTILWLCFASAVAFGMHQIRLERRWLKHVTALSASSNNSSSRRKHSMATGGSSPSDPELGGSSGKGRKNYTRSGGRIVRSSSRTSGSRDRMIHSISMASINSSSNPGNSGDEPAVSSGDVARATFRRLIMTAMVSRTIAIPIQIYSDPLWLQLIADTFPVMAFATAWTWLVSFFVQLVGVALGTNPLGSASGGGATIGGSNGRPVATIDTVIQITAYVIYAVLIISFTVFRRIAAAVLLYGLLCCVYATLLGMGLYYCPRLLSLLLPGLGGKWHSPLALRLIACSSACLLVFAGHTFSFARKVVQSTIPYHKENGPYWWFQYGALEFLPAILFLALLHPKRTERATSNSSSENTTKSPSDPNYLPTSGRRTPPLHSYHKRADSGDSISGARTTLSPQPSRSPTPPLSRQPQHGGSSSIGNPNKETTPLLSTHPSQRYGGSTMSGSHAEAIISIDAISNPHHHQLQQID